MGCLQEITATMQKPPRNTVIATKMAPRSNRNHVDAIGKCSNHPETPGTKRVCGGVRVLHILKVQREAFHVIAECDTFKVLDILLAWQPAPRSRCSRLIPEKDQRDKWQSSRCFQEVAATIYKPQGSNTNPPDASTIKQQPFRSLQEINSRVHTCAKMLCHTFQRTFCTELPLSLLPMSTSTNLLFQHSPCTTRSINEVSSI